MKDCTHCPARADINPQYKIIPFCDTPCAKCRGHEVKIRSRDMCYNDAVESTPVVHPGRRMRVDVDIWEEFAPRQKKIIRGILDNPGMSKAKIARTIGVAHATLYRELDRIRQIIGDRLDSVFV